MAEEKQHLVAATEKRSNFDSSSKTTTDTWKHKLGLIALLSLQFCHLTTDSFLIPFYPAEALSKNLTQTHIGLVYSALFFKFETIEKQPKVVIDSFTANSQYLVIRRNRDGGIACWVNQKPLPSTQ